MDLSSVNHHALAPVTGSANTAPEPSPRNRDIIQAVKAINNAALLGDENQLRFERDPDTRRMVVKIINPRTNEVVSQIPAEYVLRLAKDLKIFES